MNIYPSLLEYSTESLEERIQACESLFPYVQVDCVDRSFSEKPTAELEDIIEVLEKFPEMAFELHLMIEHPEDTLEYLREYDMVHRVIMPLSSYRDSLRRMGADIRQQKWPFQLGIAINPGDSFDTYETLVEHFPVVQIMTVEPGVQGGVFIESQLSHIGHLRDHGYTGEIILDGGINDETIQKVLAHKHLPTAVCPGSYFREDVRARLATLTNLVAK